MGYKLMTYFIKVSLKEVMDKKIFLLLWTSLIFSGRSISSSAGASVLGEPFCSNEFCITVSNDEITAEPGLCVVIPCSFTTPSYFKPQHLIWFKCESNKICFHSEKIFHTNKNTPPYKSEFMGRVSLLDPDVNHQNCSIRISDLRESDSGFYQLRVNGYSDRASDGFTFNKRTSVNVGGFRQKPTMTLPDLTEGHQTTLTCSAPALCSTSPPGISWMWRGAAEKDPLINGSITAFKNETLTAVTQRHNSTLTFIPTAELHNSNITCRIRFSDNTTTEETVNLHVNFKQKSMVAVLIRVSTLVILSCLIISIFWKKMKRTDNLQDALEMVACQDDPLIHDGLAEADYQNCLTEGAENGSETRGQAAPELRSGSRDV